MATAKKQTTPGADASAQAPEATGTDIPSEQAAALAEQSEQQSLAGVEAPSDAASDAPAETPTDATTEVGADLSGQDAASSTTDTSAQAATELTALAVVVFKYGDVPIGELVRGPVSLIDQHAKHGNVDANPEAVARAEQAGVACTDLA